MPVVVEDFGDVDLGAGEDVGLVDPVGVFSVIFRGEFALDGDGATPSARMPGTAADDVGGLPLFIEFVGDVEGDDADAGAGEGGELVEGDDVGIGSEGGDDFGDVGVGELREASGNGGDEDGEDGGCVVHGIF